MLNDGGVQEQQVRAQDQFELQGEAWEICWGEHLLTWFAECGCEDVITKDCDIVKLCL